MNKFIINICSLLINLIKWLALLGVVSNVYERIQKHTASDTSITLDDICTTGFYCILLTLFILSSRFIILSKRYLYNFNYFNSDIFINQSDNLHENIIFNEDEYEDVPEPRILYRMD